MALLTQGVLGIACVLLILAVIYLYRDRQKESEKRFEELNKIADSRSEVSKALNANSLALEANNKAMELRTRATEEMAKEIADLRRVHELALRDYANDQTNVRGALNELKTAVQNSRTAS